MLHAVAPRAIRLAETTEAPAPPGTIATVSDRAERPGLGTRLALNASTGALLGAILLVGMASELWSPLMPRYLDRLQASVLVIAAYGSFRDLLEGATYWAGGLIAGRLGTRRALLLFNAMPLAGLALLLLWGSRFAIFAALPLVGVYDAIAAPATLRVVGETLAASHRTMAISLQAIQRRLSRLAAYAVGGGLVLALGEVAGVRAGIAIAVVLVALSLALQARFMHTAVADRAVLAPQPLALLSRFAPALRRLLFADILVRWAEGLPRELIVLWVVGLIATPGGDAAPASAFYVSVLLSVQAVTSLALYLPIAHLASRPGARKEPYIGLTFVFFAAFPLTLLLLGPLGRAGLVLAFVVGGLREIGEPARKALITELVPAEAESQAIGLYWAARSAAVMLAPLAGGLIWVGLGPRAMLGAAGVCGVAGALLFYAGERR